VPAPPPAIPTFRRPAAGWFALLDGGIVLLVVLACSRRAYGRVSDRLPLPPRPALWSLLGATAVIHVAEAAHAGRAARRSGLPAGPWARQTLAVGFPSLRALRQVSAAHRA
jgi:hypothetical protein